jgi:hypothetical protein
MRHLYCSISSSSSACLNCVYCYFRKRKELGLGVGEELYELTPLHSSSVADCMSPTFVYARHWFASWLETDVGIEHSPTSPDKQFLPQCFSWKCVHREYLIKSAKARDTCVVCIMILVDLFHVGAYVPRAPIVPTISRHAARILSQCGGENISNVQAITQMISNNPNLVGPLRLQNVISPQSVTTVVTSRKCS